MFEMWKTCWYHYHRKERLNFFFFVWFNLLYAPFVNREEDANQRNDCKTNSKVLNWPFQRGGGQRSPIDSKMIFPSWSSVSLWRSRSKFAILWCFWSWSFWLVLACVCLSVALWLFWRPPTKKRISTTTFFPRWAYRCAVYLWTHTKVLIFLPVSMGQRITAVRDIFKNPQNG